jgi:hypothetical protein
MNGIARRFLSTRLVAIGSAAVATWSVLFLATADAQTKRVQREVAGLGADDNAAVLSALQEATFQICGVRIQSRLDVESRYIEDDDGVRMIDRINRDIRVNSAKPVCKIDRYEVLQVSGDGTGARATLRVHYTVYRVPGPPMKRRRIAVLDFPTEDVHLYGVGGTREKIINGRTVRAGINVDFELVRKLEDEFRARIEALLTHSRRFGVLDRKQPKIYKMEKLLLQSSDAGPGERARLGKVLGADYLLYGAIDRVVVENQSKTIEITGERKDRIVGSAAVRFTVLATATRQIKWSSSIALDQVFTVRLQPEAAAAAVLEGVAAEMVDELTENIFPPLVTKVIAPGSFAVNRGGNTVTMGDVFEVFAVGDWLVDPDTGEYLDRIETSVGIARIVAVKPKYSLAELISGKADLSRGMVLRRRTVEAGAGTVPADRGPRFQDDDGDGLPDYLNRR